MWMRGGERESTNHNHTRMHLVADPAYGRGESLSLALLGRIVGPGKDREVRIER